MFSPPRRIRSGCCRRRSTTTSATAACVAAIRRQLEIPDVLEREERFDSTAGGGHSQQSTEALPRDAREHHGVVLETAGGQTSEQRSHRTVGGPAEAIRRLVRQSTNPEVVAFIEASAA